jgi:hypothetical protein
MTQHSSRCRVASSGPNGNERWCCLDDGLMGSQDFITPLVEHLESMTYTQLEKLRQPLLTGKPSEVT